MYDETSRLVIYTHGPNLSKVPIFLHNMIVISFRLWMIAGVDAF